MSKKLNRYYYTDLKIFYDNTDMLRARINLLRPPLNFPRALRQKEKVLWSGSRGYLGAALTNLRFFVISTSSSVWHTLPLKLDESKKSVTSLSPYIALLVVGDRSVGFDAVSNRFIETPISIRDELLAAEANKYVAVMITSSRAFGLAIKRSAFSEIPF